MKAKWVSNVNVELAFGTQVIREIKGIKKIFRVWGLIAKRK